MWQHFPSGNALGFVQIFLVKDIWPRNGLHFTNFKAPPRPGKKACLATSSKESVFCLQFLCHLHLNPNVSESSVLLAIVATIHSYGVYIYKYICTNILLRPKITQDHLRSVMVQARCCLVRSFLLSRSKHIVHVSIMPMSWHDAFDALHMQRCMRCMSRFRCVKACCRDALDIFLLQLHATAVDTLGRFDGDVLAILITFCLLWLALLCCISSCMTSFGVIRRRMFGMTCAAASYGMIVM